MGLFDKLFKKEQQEQKKEGYSEEKKQADNQDNDHKFRMELTEKTLLEILHDYKLNKKNNKLILSGNHWIYRFEEPKQVHIIKIDNLCKFQIIFDSYWFTITSHRLHNLIDEIFLIKNSIKETEPFYKEPIIKEEPVITHRLKDKYNLLVRQIKLRQEELKAYNLNDPRRQTLNSELENYKNIARNMKHKILNNL